MIFPSKLKHYLPRIKNKKSMELTTRDKLLTNDLLIEKENNLKMYYAPHNEFIETNASIVIVGITPGFQQMKIALQSVLRNIDQNYSLEYILKQAKIDASFQGQMRNNLIHMLDLCGLHHLLNIQTTEKLFTTKRSLLHTTSIIRYPVFYKGRNYAGHQPHLDLSPMLKRYAFEQFPKELNNLTKQTLIIPLGKTVERILYKVDNQIHPRHTIVNGFPHPSGANGHRKKQFAANKEYISRLISDWACEHKKR